MSELLQLANELPIQNQINTEDIQDWVFKYVFLVKYFVMIFCDFIINLSIIWDFPYPRSSRS